MNIRTCGAVFVLLLLSFFSIPSAATAQHNHQVAQDEQRLSYWGYRHKEAHEKGWIRQLQQKTNRSCCSSPTDGECRITTVNMSERMALIDGIWCPITHHAAIAVIDGMDDGVALLCAGKMRSGCPNTYCIGLNGTRM